MRTWVVVCGVFWSSSCFCRPKGQRACSVASGCAACCSRRSKPQVLGKAWCPRSSRNARGRFSFVVWDEFTSKRSRRPLGPQLGTSWTGLGPSFRFARPGSFIWFMEIWGSRSEIKRRRANSSSASQLLFFLGLVPPTFFFFKITQTSLLFFLFLFLLLVELILRSWSTDDGRAFFAATAPRSPHRGRQRTKTWKQQQHTSCQL